METMDFIRYITQAGFAGIAAALVLLVYRITIGNQASEQILMTILKSVLADNAKNMATLTLEVQTRHEALMERVQSRQDESLMSLFQQIADQMAPIIARRDAAHLELTADVRTVPAEVWRLGTPKLESLQNQLTRLMNDFRNEIMLRIDPKEENVRARDARAAVALELREVHEKFDILIRQMKDIEETVKALRLRDANATKKSTQEILDLSAKVIAKHDRTQSRRKPSTDEIPDLVAGETAHRTAELPIVEQESKPDDPADKEQEE